MSSYERKVLYQCEFFEVVSIEWTQSNATALHDHGFSQCSVLIESGIFEDRLQVGSKTELRVYETGQAIHTPYGAKHEIKCLTPKGKTLHVYTPKMSKDHEVNRFDGKLTADLKAELKLDEPLRWDGLQNILSRMRGQSISTHSPFFMNQLFAGVPSQMLLADSLIAQTKTTLATSEASPVFSSVEREVVVALGDRIGWSAQTCDGIGVPGGSAANFMAVHCARQQRAPEIKKVGMSGQQFKLYVSEDAHYSFNKAAVALGLGLGSVSLVPTDISGKMIVRALEEQVLRDLNEGAIPLMVCATAGTTVFGAFDPIDEISNVCKKHKLWLHVDAAWGGPALFSERLKDLVVGVSSADSVTFDAHKFFGASLTCSFFLTRHPKILLEANDVSGADYLFHTDDASLDRGKSSWQCGRRADALSFWTIWKSLGTLGLSAQVDRQLSVRDEAIAWVKTQPRLNLIANPPYLNICVRVVPPHADQEAREWSKRVRDRLKEKNLAMVNFAKDADGTFLRLILAHPDLEFSHLKQMLTWALEVE